MVVNDLRRCLSEMESGRFRLLVEALDGLCQDCLVCSHFNPSATDSFRCKVTGSCPVATIHPKLITYWQHELGWWVTSPEENKTYQDKLEETIDGLRENYEMRQLAMRIGNSIHTQNKFRGGLE